MEKICVVGGGISGISTAYYLQQSGHDVVLLEGKEHLGAGATSIATPVLRKYQSPLIDYPVYEKIKSKFCPVRMFSKGVTMGDMYSHKAFKTAYGYDILKLAFNPFEISRNTEKLTTLTAANYANTLDLIRNEGLEFPVGYGYLQIGDDKTKMKQLRTSMKRVNMILHDNEVIHLPKEDPARYFPAVQQNKIDLYGGFYDPTALVFQPTDFVNALAKSITKYSNEARTKNGDKKHGQVEFKMQTRATGFTLAPDGRIVSVETDTDESIPVDRVVLCNGYAAFQITEDLVEEGPLLQVIPIRSFGYDVLDRTRARQEYTVPSLFPTYPLTFFPEDPIYKQLQEEYERDEAERRELLAKGIYVESKYQRNAMTGPGASATGPEVPPLPQEDVFELSENMQLGPVAAVEFLRIGTVLAADPKNSRHVYGYGGKDMGELSGEIDDQHIQGVLGVLETIRQVPQGSVIDPYFLDENNLVNLTDELKKRYEVEKQRFEDDKSSGLSKILPFSRPNDERISINREPIGSRYLSMQTRAISLHTIGRDGLPMIGPSHKIPNLMFNTGHGPMPQNTAIIAGKMIADMVYTENAGNNNQDGSENTDHTTPVIAIDTQLHGLKSNDIIRYSDYSPKRFELKPFKTAWFEQSLAARKAAAERKAQEALLRKHIKLQELKKQKEAEGQLQQPSTSDGEFQADNTH